MAWTSFSSIRTFQIDLDDAGIKKLADKIKKKGFDVGSVVAPVWSDGSAMGTKSSGRTA